MRGSFLGWFASLTLLVAGVSAEPGAEAPTLDAVPAQPAVPIEATFLAPNVEDRDGTPAYVHVTPADMPLRVAVGYPKRGYIHGTRADGRDVAIEAMRLWETALRGHLPWFALEFVEHDRDAPVQIEWKRRIAGPWGGFGGIRWWLVDGRLRVGGRMQVSTTPGAHSEPSITRDELRLLIAHEFGHVLGLGHCHDCESAMNYSWATRDRIVVTDLDVRTFIALMQTPNGTRVDGELMQGLRADGSD